jgi:glutamate:GABA antiporter
MKSSVGKGATLGVFALAMINVAAIVSPRNGPLMADYGWSMLFFLGCSVLLFLIPIAFASAELATGWPKAGGVYAWVREAFGTRTGFLAVWCDWSENLTWFPTVLSFIAGSLAYAISPGLASDNVFLVAVMLSVFWAATALNFLRLDQSTRVATIGTILGAFVPILLLAGLAIAWFAKGEGSQIPFSGDALMPQLSGQHLLFLGGILLSFAGMEMAGFHALETRNPRRDYPRAMLLASVIIVGFSLAMSLSIALVVPAHEISLLSGAMQAAQDMLDRLGIGELVKPVAILLVLGGVAHLTPWILGPAKGLAAVARGGHLPPLLGRMSGNGVPVQGLLVQAVGGTVFCLLFLFLPDANTTYGALTAMTAQVIVIMYVLIFASVIRLRYTQPDTERGYRIPGGTLGVWFIAGAGIVACAFAFVAGFFPPGEWPSMDTGQRLTYYAVLLGGFALLTAPPFLLRVLRREGWPAAEAAPALEEAT